MGTNQKIVVIHLLSDISRINFGVWNPVISTIPYLKKMGAEVELWFPESNDEIHDEIKHFKYQIITKKPSTLNSQLSTLNSELSTLNPQSTTSKWSSGQAIQGLPSTIFISHGCWSWATKTGYRMKKHGYKWIAVPHGMLEPWSLQQKWLKKQVYFHTIEKHQLKKADAVIAVGGPEAENLGKWFRNVYHIPNGIEPFGEEIGKWEDGEMGGAADQLNGKFVNPEDSGDFLPISPSPRLPISFLFLGRLHYKKGVVPLVKAWLASTLCNDDRFQLIIAGPDEGELSRLKALLKKENKAGTDHLDKNHKSRITNRESQIKFPGPVYGKDKTNLLLQSTFFLLPSQSEGFPTSIVEAMTHGCIPIITPGCNFPEVFKAGVAEEVEFDIDDIRKKLEEVSTWDHEKISLKAKQAKEFADTNYSLEIIARKQYELFQKILYGLTV